MQRLVDSGRELLHQLPTVLERTGRRPSDVHLWLLDGGGWSASRLVIQRCFAVGTKMRMDSSQAIPGSEGGGAPRDSDRNGTRFTAVIRLGALLAYSALILYFGTAQPQSIPATELLGHDKLLHAAAFGGLGVLMYRCYAWYWPRVAVRWSVGLPIAASTLVGAILELVQATLPYRSMEFADLVADLAGAALLVLWAKWVRLERPLLRYGF